MSAWILSLLRSFHIFRPQGQCCCKDESLAFTLPLLGWTGCCCQCSNASKLILTRVKAYVEVKTLAMAFSNVVFELCMHHQNIWCRASRSEKKTSEGVPEQNNDIQHAKITSDLLVQSLLDGSPSEQASVSWTPRGPVVSLQQIFSSSLLIGLYTSTSHK